MPAQISLGGATWAASDFQDRLKLLSSHASWPSNSLKAGYFMEGLGDRRLRARISATNLSFRLRTTVVYFPFRGVEALYLVKRRSA